MSKRFFLALVAVTALSGIGGAVAVSATSFGAGTQTPQNNGGYEQVDVANPSDAVSELSERVGFTVRTPKAPTGFGLQAAEAFTGPPNENGLPYASTSYARNARDLSNSASASIEVLQLGLRLTHAANDAKEPYDVGLPGVDVVVSRAKDQDVYTLRTNDQTFIVLIRQPTAIAAADTKALLESLVA